MSAFLPASAHLARIIQWDAATRTDHDCDGSMDEREAPGLRFPTAAMRQSETVPIPVPTAPAESFNDDLPF